MFLFNEKNDSHKMGMQQIYTLASFNICPALAQASRYIGCVCAGTKRNSATRGRYYSIQPIDYGQSHFSQLLARRARVLTLPTLRKIRKFSQSNPPRRVPLFSTTAVAVNRKIFSILQDKVEINSLYFSSFECQETSAQPTANDRNLV